MLDRNRGDNNGSFRRVLDAFCSHIDHGNTYELTGLLYGRYVVEDFMYADDWKYHTIFNYFEKQVIPHKVAVFDYGMELIDRRLVPSHLVEEFIDNLYLHDLSKFSAQEAWGYAAFNFSDEHANDIQTRDNMELAWHHHKTHNEHHPEYWLSVKRNGSTKVLEMPEIYVFEMIADWMGAGKTYGTSLKEWVPKNIDTFSFAPATKRMVLKILEQL